MVRKIPLEVQMLYVEDWARNKPALVAMSAIQLVTIADYLYEVLPQAKDRRIFGHFIPMPDDLEIWHRMYRNPIAPLRAFVRFLIEVDKIGEAIVAITFAGRYLQRLLKRNPHYFRDNPPTREQVREGQEYLKKLFSALFDEIKNNLDEQPLDPVRKVWFSNYLTDNEQKLGFFLFLYFPSLMIYQKSPYLLYREAAAGNIESIEKLLKLDPLMQHDKVIGRHIQNLRFSNSTNDYERLTAAVHKLAITDYSDISEARKRSKVEIAAMIKAVSQLAGKRLTSTMIAKLFHAYAKDKNREALIDTDIPEGESLIKAINRHIGPWNALFQKPDI